MPIKSIDIGDSWHWNVWQSSPLTLYQTSGAEFSQLRLNTPQVMGNLSPQEEASSFLATWPSKPFLLT